MRTLVVFQDPTGAVEHRSIFDIDLIGQAELCTGKTFGIRMLQESVSTKYLVISIEHDVRTTLGIINEVVVRCMPTYN